MLKRIGTGVVLVAVVAAAGALFVAQATPEPTPGKAALTPVAVPAGDKPFARICKSDGIADARPDPAWVGASFAGDNCQAPRMPVAIDGHTASRKQVVASMDATKRYAVASEAFERCVQDFVAARRAQAGQSGKSISTPLVVIENHRIAASQRNRKLVSAQVATAINNFNEYGSDCPG